MSEVSVCAASAGQWPDAAWDQQLVQPDSQLRQTSSVHGKNMVQKAAKFRFHSSAPALLICFVSLQRKACKRAVSKRLQNYIQLEALHCI
jgi:hypothetical protein